MNRFDEIKRWTWSVFVVGALAFALAGCEGSTGPAGPPGPTGETGADGQPAPEPDPIDAAVDLAQVESCSTCHGDVGDVRHQGIYDQYSDASRLGFEITNFQSTDIGGGEFSLEVNFTITWDGTPYFDPVGNPPSLDSTSFYFAEYDIATGQFVNSAGGFAFSLDSANAASNGNGSYTLTQTVSVDPTTFTSGALMGRIADGKLPIEERQAGKRVTMYADNASDYWEFGNVNAFVSPANVGGCQDCHGTPYYKHGNYPGDVAGTPDFEICKGCHNSTSSGGHEEWQFMVDNPVAWADGVAYTPEEVALYAYDRTLVNDVHMSHALEFPYPQSMSNCATCHEGKLTQVLDNSNFQIETCKSCHVIRGLDSWPGEAYNQPHRPPAFSYLWQRDADLTFHETLVDPDCTACHGNPSVGAPELVDYHSGYDKLIYDDQGNRYADTYTASIGAITYDDVNSTLTVEYSASDPAVVPELLVSFYGWDSKDFIVPSHWRDGSEGICSSSSGCRFEWEPADDDTNPLFTEVVDAPPNWTVTANLSAYVAELTDDIPTLILNQDVKKIEVTLTPYIVIDGEEITLNSATATYDLLAKDLFAGDYFKGTTAIADYQKCNACHDQLAVTFHSGSGRAGEMTMCRNCHASTNGGSHLEMQGRSIEGYVHAIHSFQDFDLQGGRSPGIFDEFDAVLSKRYDMHIEHAFPYFTALACEACHKAGTYNVPDQKKSMPGLLSDSWVLNTWYEMVPAANGSAAIEDPTGRNIGSVPEYVVGPASKACGACHRAEMINEDKAGDLAAFNAHTDAFGTLVENDPDDEVLFGIIDKIMTWFE